MNEMTVQKKQPVFLVVVQNYT